MPVWSRSAWGTTTSSLPSITSCTRATKSSRTRSWPGRPGGAHALDQDRCPVPRRPSVAPAQVCRGLLIDAQLFRRTWRPRRRAGHRAARSDAARRDRRQHRRSEAAGRTGRAQPGEMFAEAIEVVELGPDQRALLASHGNHYVSAASRAFRTAAACSTELTLVPRGHAAPYESVADRHVAAHARGL